jgi:hypothetical protein
MYYTKEAFSDKLYLWKPKQCSLILQSKKRSIMKEKDQIQEIQSNLCS